MVTARRDLGQNIFIVAFDITETENGYEFYQKELPQGGIWRRDLIISTIIRAKYSADKMEAIMMNVMADPTNRDARDEHLALQQWRKKAKQWATELMQWAQEHGVAVNELEPAPAPAEPDTTIEETDGMAVIGAAVELAKEQAAELEDEQAITVVDLFPLWADLIGQPLTAGQRVKFAGRLWKVLQDHTAQDDWTPDVAASLFTEVVAGGGGGTDEPGTLANPIPYNNNMELEEGKYYSQYDVVYLCIRSTGVPVYNNLADLVNIYVQVA